MLFIQIWKKNHSNVLPRYPKIIFFIIFYFPFFLSRCFCVRLESCSVVLTGRSVGWLGFDLRGMSALQDPPVYCLCVCGFFYGRGTNKKTKTVFMD